MIYHLYWSRCRHCNEVHQWPRYELFGIMLMRNPIDMRDARRLELLNDQHEIMQNTTFMYVADLAQSYERKIVEANPNLQQSNSFNAGKEVFSMICDAVNGVRYRFGSPSDLPVLCPYCGDSRIPNWGPTENPYETVELEIPQITHVHFDALSEPEKKDLVYNETWRGLEHWHKIRTVYEPYRPEKTILENLARIDETNYGREHLLKPLMDFNIES